MSCSLGKICTRDLSRISGDTWPKACIFRDIKCRKGLLMVMMSMKRLSIMRSCSRGKAVVRADDLQFHPRGPLICKWVTVAGSHSNLTSGHCWRRTDDTLVQPKSIGSAYATSWWGSLPLILMCCRSSRRRADSLYCNHLTTACWLSTGQPSPLCGDKSSCVGLESRLAVLHLLHTYSQRW